MKKSIFKKFLLAFLSGVLLGLSFPEQAAAQIKPASDWVPFPWSLPQDFPWTGVQGTWRSYKSNPDWIFSLKVTYQKNQVGNILEIKVVDPKTCRLIAHGTGIERNRVVKGQLVSKQGTLRIALGSFEPSRAKRSTAGLYVDGVFAVSITRLKETKPMAEFQIVKESPSEISANYCSDSSR